MQLIGHFPQLPLWRNLTRFDSAKIASDIAIRNTLGIILALVVGEALGHPSAGVVAALGALNVSYSDSRDPYITRARRMLVASALVATAVSLGSLAAHTRVSTVALAVIWAFAACMLGVLGTRAADLGITTLATLVAFEARPMPVAIALQSGLVALAGGLLQTLLSVAVWPLGRYRPERRIIADLYSTLAKLASSPAGPDAAPPGGEQLTATQDALASLAQDYSLEAERCIFLLNQAERIRLSLLTLRRLAKRLAREAQETEAVAALETILAKASALLHSLSLSLLHDKPAARPDLAHDQLNDLKITSPAAAALIHDARHQIDALAGQLRAAARMSGDTVPRDAKEHWQLRISSYRARLYANLSFQSTIYRHALRLAVCIGLGELIGLRFDIQRSYWLPMTIAIILRPDFTATFSRGLLRIAGTLAGLLVATVLFRFLRAGDVDDIAALSVFTFLLRWAGPANYGIFVSALSAFVVLTIALTGVSPKEVISARALNTVIGGALALAAYWLWPTWEHTQSGPIFADLLEAYRNYIRAVSDAWAGKPEADLESTRSKARVARSNAEAFVTRTAAEPAVSPALANLFNAILVSSHAFIRAVMALESNLYGTRADPPGPAALDFMRKVDETLAGLIQALRNSTPLPRELPDLRAAQSLMEDHYSLVGVETDRMTTGLNTLHEEIESLLRG